MIRRPRGPGALGRWAGALALVWAHASCSPPDEPVAPVDSQVELESDPPADSDPEDPPVEDPEFDVIDLHPVAAPGPAGCGAPWCEEAAVRGLSGEAWYGRGVAWVDVDGDGWEDLWLSHDYGDHAGADHTSRLFRSLEGAGFEPWDLGISGWLLRSNQAGVWADYDNDGDQDLYLANGGHTRRIRDVLLRNDLATGGGFVDVTEQVGMVAPPGMTWGAAWADANNDGYLDLLVSESEDPCIEPCEGVATTGVPLATELSVVRLYVSQGGDGFVDRAAELGVLPGVVDGSNPAWVDYDRDGWPDLVLGNQGTTRSHPGDAYVPGLAGRARILRNVGGTGFEDVSETMFFLQEHREPVSAVAALDADQDGWEDIFLGRAYEQDRLLRNRPGDSFWPHGSVAGLGTAVGMEGQENTRGLSVGDLSGDGFPEVLIGPGSGSFAAPAILFSNRGDGTFRRLDPSEFGPVPALHNGGAAFSDFDHDGDVDMAWNPGGDPEWDQAFGHDSRDAPLLWVNHGGAAGSTAALRLVGTVSNRDAIGARVTVQSDPPVFYVRHGMQGYPSDHGPWITLALGDLEVAPVEILWPSGTVSTVELPAGSRSVIHEPLPP